jgi:hypothetical protein
MAKVQLILWSMCRCAVKSGHLGRPIRSPKFGRPNSLAGHGNGGRRLGQGFLVLKRKTGMLLLPSQKEYNYRAEKRVDKEDTGT